MGQPADARPRQIVGDAAELMNLGYAVGNLVRRTADDGAALHDRVPLQRLKPIAGRRVHLVAFYRRLALRRSDVLGERVEVPHHGILEVRQRLFFRLCNVGHDQASDLVIVRVAVVLAQGLAILLDLSGALVDIEAKHRGAHQVESVLAAKLERGRRKRRHPDGRMGLLEGFRPDRQILELVELPIIVELLGGPGLLDDLDRLVEDVTAACLVDAIAGELVRLVAAPDAKIDSTPGEEIENRKVLRHPHRMVERQNHDASPEADVLRTGSQRRKGHCWRGAVAILAEVVLGWPDRIEAELLGSRHDVELLVDDLFLRAPHRVFEEMKLAEFHWEHSPEPFRTGIWPTRATGSN